MAYTPASFAAGEGSQNITQFFKKLSDAGINQVVELPYNKSLLASIGKQTKIHNIAEMQETPMRRPEPKSLMGEFRDSLNIIMKEKCCPL